jgi:2-oxoglutarate ferredoxin oxidoreductase subunit beta
MLDVVTPREPITADYEPGAAEEVTQHDGSVLRLRKLARDHDPHDRAAALAFLQQRQGVGEIVTGLLYVDRHPRDLHDHLGTVGTPLNQHGEAELCPGAGALAAFNAAHR